MTHTTHSLEDFTPERILDDAFNIGKSNFPEDYKTLKTGMLKKLDHYTTTKIEKTLEELSSDINDKVMNNDGEDIEWAFEAIEAKLSQIRKEQV